MIGPPYTPCVLFYDSPRKLSVGDFLKTRAGSAYLVQSVRINSKRPYRQHLKCVRWPLAEIPEDASVYLLIWYPRKRRRTTLQQLATRARGR